VKFSLREIERIVSIKTLSFEKCLNYGISGFQRGDIFKLWQYWTERILLNDFSCFQTASLGGSGLSNLKIIWFGNLRAAINSKSQLDIVVVRGENDFGATKNFVNVASAIRYCCGDNFTDYDNKCYCCNDSYYWKIGVTATILVCWGYMNYTLCWSNKVIFAM